MDSVRNPYAPGAGNPPPELAGRADILSTVDVVLRRTSEGRAVQFPILVGLRGVGKTVLLNRAREMAEALHFLVVDVEAHEGKALAELLLPGFRRCLFALNTLDAARDKARRGLRVLKSFLSGLKINVAGVEIGLDAELGVADSGDLEADLPELILALGEAAKAANRPVAIIIDELQYLSTIEFSALIMGMHKINQRQLPLVMIGAGLPQILGLAGNSKSYAERLFTYPRIGALSPDDAAAAIINPALAEQVTIDPAAIQQIMAVTDRYPYFLQQWSHDAWNVAAGDGITAADVARATPISIAALDQSFFQVRFDRCTPTEKIYMRALAELGPGAHRSGDIAEKLKLSTTSAAPTRSALIKKGMIYSPAYGDTAFTVPLFDDYLRRTIPVFRPKDRTV
ncbi:MAG: ATP-binding protein [Alphaproteobacteria bacterium]|nr:ATP-binding protein [Alphaproteobacteria bacterium]